jgi:hypothetical protein
LQQLNLIITCYDGVRPNKHRSMQRECPVPTGIIAKLLTKVGP